MIYRFAQNNSFIKCYLPFCSCYCNQFVIIIFKILKIPINLKIQKLLVSPKKKKFKEKKNNSENKYVSGYVPWCLNLTVYTCTEN